MLKLLERPGKYFMRQNTINIKTEIMKPENSKKLIEVLQDEGFTAAVLLDEKNKTITPITNVASVKGLTESMIFCRDAVQHFLNDLTTKIKGSN